MTNDGSGNVPRGSTGGEREPTGTPASPSARGRERSSSHRADATPTSPDPAIPTTSTPGDWPTPDGLRSDEPAWLVLAVTGLLLGLLAPLAIVLAARDGGDDIEISAPISPPLEAPTTSRATESTSPRPTTSGPATTPDTTAERQTTTAPDTTAASETTTAPATTADVAPATTDAAPTTDPPSATTPATPGSIRVVDTEYPILRACRTGPLAPANTERSVVSYLYDDNGYVGIVERWQDENGMIGGNYSSGGLPLQVESFEDRGADGFAVFPLQPGGAFEVVVQPPSSEPDDCAASSRVTTNSPGDAGDAYTRSVVDICFGDAAGPLQYVGFLSEGGRFTAEPADVDTVDLTYDEPGIFELVDAAASQIDVGGGIEIRGTVEGSNPVGPVTKEVFINFPTKGIRDCTDLD